MESEHDSVGCLFVESESVYIIMFNQKVAAPYPPKRVT